MGEPRLHYVNATNKWNLTIGGITGTVAEMSSENPCNPQGIMTILKSVDVGEDDCIGQQVFVI
jgi:5,10-methylene-tetrahydrofolate dehydrogenase/methenyl tetrahydrofolate cyclohydrolase